MARRLGDDVAPAAEAAGRLDLHSAVVRQIGQRGLFLVVLELDFGVEVLLLHVTS